LTSDDDWEPSQLDNEYNVDDAEFFDAIDDDELEYDPNHPFDDCGNYMHRHVAYLDTFENLDEDDVPPMEYLPNRDDAIDHIRLNKHEVKGKEPDYAALRPVFGWAPIDIIKKTFSATTQFARETLRGTLREHYRSRFPALNVHRRAEAVATDTVYSDTPAVDSGVKMAQFFVGRESLYCSVYPIKNEKQFVNTLEDEIRKRGAMDKLISDRAEVEISNKVTDVLRAYKIEDWQSEPYHVRKVRWRCQQWR